MSFVCVQPAVAPQYRSLADTRAVEIRPDNASDAGAPQRFWATGTVLRVRVLDTPKLARRVLAAAEAWTRYANLRFQLVNSGQAEIRLTFGGSGNWSALGTDATVAQLYPPNQPTMCLAELPVAMSSKRVDRLVRHQFGHAIGLTHGYAAGARPHPPVRNLALMQQPVRSLSSNGGADDDVLSVMRYRWAAEEPDLPEIAELSPTDRGLARRIYPGRK